jgi:ribosomal protein S18 acetylase RimI-like enzyme
MTRAIKEFLAKVREWFDDLMYSKGFDPNMSLEQFYKKVNRQILAGKLQQRATNAPVQAMALAGRMAEMSEPQKNFLKTAEAMIAAGKTSEEVRAVTGWFPGKYDGKMRFEVPDDKVKSLTPPTERSRYRLAEVMDHKALFKVYPELKDLQVKTDPSMKTNEASFSFVTFGRDSYVTLRSVMDGVDRTSVLLHEIQHWIQNYEGFALGSSPGERQNLLRARKRYEVSSNYQSDLKEVSDAIKAATKKLEAGIAEKVLGDKLTEKYRRTDELRKEVEALKDRKASIESGLVPWEFANAEYRSAAGEIESRDVQARQGFTPSQRREIPPYSSEDIDPADASVNVGLASGTRFSLAPAAKGGNFEVKYVAADEYDAEEGGVDPYEADTAVAKIAKETGVGILRGKELKAVATNKKGDIVGGLYTEVDGDEFSFDVVVSPASQRQGVGEKLAQEAFSLFQQESDGRDDLAFKVEVTNPGMEVLLGKYGFEVQRRVGQTAIMTHPTNAPRKAKTPSVSADTRFSLAPATPQDKAYVAAVESGDVAAQQKIVDDAAKAAGYNVGPVWHASDSKFDVFDLSKSKDKYPEFWFTGNKNYASNHGKYVRRFYLSDPYYRGEPEVFTSDRPERIKSADPITYDDNGKIILPSQRFDTTSPDIRFSLAPAVTKPSNVARNQAGTRVRVLMENQTYEGQTMDDAIEQALPLYDANVDKGFTVAQHMAFIQELRLNAKGKYQDMTFGAYAGMYTRDLLNESTNPERDPMSQELAKRESDKIGALMGEQLAIPGRQVKAADIFNNIANNPAMTVRHAEQLLPFDGKQNVKNDFDKAATTVREEMEGLGNEAINTAPEDAMTSMLGQRVAAVVRGEETSNVGEVVLDEVKPAETEEDLPAWFREGQELLGAELSGKIDDLTELLQVYAYLKRKDGTYSLTPEERSANVAARIKKIEDSGKTLEQALAETKKSIDEILSAFNKPKAKAKPKAAPIPKEAPPEGEIQDIVAARINRLLDKIVKPSTSPAKTRTDKEVLVDAIVSTMMAKAGLPADLKAGGDNVTLAFGLVVANPQLAAQSVQAVYDLLQSDPASANITSSDKIRGFMQMLTGQSFADGKAYGEKQLNTVLKNELKRLKISVNDVAMDAALTGKTVEQLEASLRDPSRELSKVLSPDALNKVVAAVTGEFRKSAAERADGIRSQQAQARVLQDMIDEKNMVIADFKAARAKKEKAAKDAKKKVKEYEDLWTRLKNGEDKAAIRQAERQVRAAQAADMKAEADWVAHQSAESEAISMEAQRSSRDLMEQQNKLNATDRKFRLAINRKNRKAMRRKLAKRGGFMIPLDQSEAEELLDQKPKTVLQYLAREYGFSLADIIGMARDQDRQTTLEAKVGNLAQALGLTKEQADKFMGPVIAEAMKYISEARKKDVSQRINRVLTPVIGKKKTQKTEAEKLIKLAEMGGLTADNVEKLLLNSKNAKEFTPEFRQELIDLIAQANDPHLTEETRDSLKGKFLDKIKAARGITVLSLLGEWTMSNIFMSILSTFKVNFVWGFIKAASDSGIFITISGPAAARADAIAKGVTPAPRLAVAKVLFRQWLRGYAVNMQHNAAFMWSEGLGKDESDMTSQFANTGMEILSRVKDAQIQWSNEGKVLPKSAQKVIKAMAAFGKYTRRTMVASDFINRTSAFEMSKVLEAVKVMQARGGAASTATIQREIDDALYGGNFKDAFAKANKQADDEIAEKKLGKAERGIRVGRIMDEMLGKNLGLTEKQTQEYLQGGRENAKRWSLADTTEGIFGEISNLMLAATRKIPALKFALPAIRMPIAAFSQTLDWTPYGFLRLYAIDKNSNETQSFTNYLFNRNGEYGNWNKPVGGVPAYRKTDLMAKATIGSMIMIGLCIKAALSFDEDEDEADFYITGLGPSDPAENKAWREKGNAPFTFRFNGGTGFRFQESPFYGMLAPIAAWSDAHRYGKPGEAESDRIAYAMGKTLAGFQEAVVMKNLSDILAGGSSYSADGQLRNWSKATSRLASNVLMPRLGGEINTILYGPQDQKALGWGGRALANVPFVPSFNNKPAQDFLGREIHTKREGMLGEIYPALAHRVIAPSLDDPILNFVAKMSPNFLATTRRFKDGTRVMDNYEFVRKWNAAAGVKIREYLTPERMASYERKLAKDKPDAQTEFNVEINKIRTAALRKFSEVQF